MKSNYHKIIFLVEMRDPFSDATSSQIMASNLLYGFNQISDVTIFVPIVSKAVSRDNIQIKYRDRCDEIIFFELLTKINCNAYEALVSNMLNIMFNRGKIPDKLVNCIDDDTILITQAPGIDSVLYANLLKKKFPKIKYIQYWADPVALSLIMPSQFSKKRMFHKFYESKAHRAADKIVYGTQSLYTSELKLFPYIANKSIWVDVSYCPESKDKREGYDEPVFGYFGNYYSTIRNIVPFYKAATHYEGIKTIICGAGDIQLNSSKNVSIMNRVPQIEVSELESKIDVVVCILNKVGMQIPGKVFYQTNTSKTILVIIDGPNQKEIVKELTKYNRFIFCKNDEKSILETMDNIVKRTIENNEFESAGFSPASVCRNIIEKK